ncbi:MAG: HPr kinase/phosphatase C-terminal domain-containing protein [Proteobacteria bacterium]|nr:HPr kinase/phosphatase C-terminal domain-containing protein [Pseudomonadota bacterium]
MSGEVERVHGTAIAIGSRAVLIRGPSGSGKSDLALRCLGLGVSAIAREPIKLVADDQVLLKHEDTALRASAPPSLRGKLEVRGLGILEVDPIREATLVLIADLVRDDVIERYPDPWPSARILGFDVPALRLSAFEGSSALKLVTAILMAPPPRIVPKA